MEAAPGPLGIDDDDLLPSLPALEGDESGIDVDPADGIEEGPELVGLDTATGPDDLGALFDLEELEEGEPPGAWDTTEEPIAEVPELDAGEEGRWTEDSEPADSVPWETLIDAADEAPAASDDRGDEGVEERFNEWGEEGASEGHAAPRLRGEEELADDLELERDKEIESAFDERLEHPAFALPRLDPARVEVVWMGPHGEAIVALSEGFACGRGLYRLEGDRALPIDLEGLEGDEPTSIVRTASGAWIVGLRLGGIARCVDGRRLERFEGLEGLEGARRDATCAMFVEDEVFEGGTRIWVRTRGGALLRSEDEGATWSRPPLPGAVIVLARAGDGGVVGVMGARSGALDVVRTRDGGRSWRRLAGPRLDRVSEQHEMSIAAYGSHLAIACGAPGEPALVSSDHGHVWAPIEATRGAGPLAIVEEGGSAVLYAGVFQEGLDRGCVVRVPLAAPGEPRVVLDLEEVCARHRIVGAGDEGHQRILALAAKRGREGTVLHVGSGLGVIRARLR